MPGCRGRSPHLRPAGRALSPPPPRPPPHPPAPPPRPPPPLRAPPGGPPPRLPISEWRLILESTDGTMCSLRLPPWLAVGPRGEVRLLHGGRIYALHPPGDFAPLTLPRLPASPRAVHAT